MREVYKSKVVVIPSLEPEEKLISYVKDLIEKGFLYIIVINDGSDDRYSWIFEKLNRLERCEVLTHEVNLGKGAALKTGFRYIDKNLSDFNGVVTADADGQHSIVDVCRMAETIEQYPHTFLLGTRNFHNGNTPIKSRIGNSFSSVMFFCLFGKWLPDTQTGLRGFDRSLIKYMCEITGNRFEYEMQVLIKCVTDRVSIDKILITTVYENANAGTHFKVLRDSFLVMKVLFCSFFKYVISSILSAVLDLSIAWILLDILRPYTMGNNLLRIAAASLTARLVSMVFNYNMNKRFVFQEKRKHTGSSIRYTFLCIANIILSISVVFVGSEYFGFHEKVLKIVVDTILFLMNYQIQRVWGFGSQREGG